MKEKITRKDGIEYERAKKPTTYDCNLNIRFTKESLEKIKMIAEKENVSYNQLIRKLIEDYINWYENGK